MVFMMAFIFACPDTFPRSSSSERWRLREPCTSRHSVRKRGFRTRRFWDSCRGGTGTAAGCRADRERGSGLVDERAKTSPLSDVHRRICTSKARGLRKYVAQLRRYEELNKDCVKFRDTGFAQDQIEFMLEWERIVPVISLDEDASVTSGLSYYSHAGAYSRGGSP